mgnify:CR=1 FL=1
MRPFVENFPFFSIFLAILAAIVTAAIRSGRISYWITIGVCAASALLNGWVLEYTYTEGVSFTYAMGRFLAPYGNAINCGPLQALLAAVFSLVMALALAGGRRDLFQDILPEKQKFYFVMVNMLEASLLALTYTNDMFTGYVFIETSTIAACALVMAKDNGPNLIATIRYLFMSLVGSGLFLIGLTILNSITGYLLMPSLAEAVAELRLSESYTLPLTVAVGLLVAGLGVKSAMFPFHLWLPDAHGGATTASSAILSGLVLKGYIVLLLVMILRVFSMELMVELGVTDVILAFGLLGMILGSGCYAGEPYQADAGEFLRGAGGVYLHGCGPGEHRGADRLLFPYPGPCLLQAAAVSLRRQTLRRQRPPQEPEEPAGQRLPGHWGGLGLHCGGPVHDRHPPVRRLCLQALLCQRGRAHRYDGDDPADHRPVHGAERTVLCSGAAGHLGEAPGGG